MTTTLAYAGLSENSVLACLNEGEFRRLSPFLKAVRLEALQSLYMPGDDISHAYFPIDCVVTGQAMMSDGATVETVMIGREGIVGIAAVMGRLSATHWTRVLLPGQALRLATGVLRELFAENPNCQSLLLRYYSVLLNQISRRALCNTRHRVVERFCTWLLMAHDRAPADDFPLTQETISRQLGVRRAGVNEAVGELRRLGAIEHDRGHIRVRSRTGLEAFACLCYRSFNADMDWFGDYHGGTSLVRPV